MNDNTAFSKSEWYGNGRRDRVKKSKKKNKNKNRQKRSNNDTY